MQRTSRISAVHCDARNAIGRKPAVHTQEICCTGDVGPSDPAGACDPVRPADGPPTAAHQVSALTDDRETPL